MSDSSWGASRSETDRSSELLRRRKQLLRVVYARARESGMGGDGNKALRAKERTPAGWQQQQQSTLMQDVGAEDGDAAVANRVPLQI